jgi:hypothetical protein
MNKLADFEVLVPRNGKPYKVKVKILLKWDEELEIWVLTPQAYELINNVKFFHKLIK